MHIYIYIYIYICPVSKKRFEILQQHWSNVLTLLQCWWSVPICCPTHLENVCSSYYVNYCIIFMYRKI